MIKTKAELRADIEALELERRSFMEEVRHGTGEFNEEEAKSKLADFDKRRADLEKAYAEIDKPEGGKEGITLTNRDFVEAAKEMRAITIGGNGKINQVQQLFEGIGEKDDILNAVTFDYSDNASTNIPVLEPGLEEPVDTAEGGSSINEDDEAEMKTTEIQVYGLASVLGVTAEALQLNTVDIQSKLPELFRKAFRKKLHTKVLQGSLISNTQKGVKGIWTSAAANTAGITQLAASQTSIKCSDLAGLALKVSGYDETFEIVMNPATYQNVLSDSTSGEDVKLYKEGLIRSKEIEGVKVRLDAKAPKATTAGSILAVAVPLSRFHVGVAGGITITPIKVKGDSKTYFQAEAFVGGKQVTDTDLFSLAVKASS